MKKPCVLFFAFLLALQFGCKKEDDVFFSIDISTGWFPGTPVNIEGVNTTFDDYNSNLEGFAQRINLYHSTNYPKKGADFDITGVSIDFHVNETQDGMTYSISNDPPAYATSLFPLVNTSADEYGPFSFYSENSQSAGSRWFFFYANDENGQFDIKYVYTDPRDWGTYGASAEMHGPYYADVLNSNVCDFYPTINTDRSKMYFSSYRKGKYDIYEIDCSTADFLNWLENGTNDAKLNTVLSSEGYDKCPYINGNLLVFASDRDDGYGGYDLWYSVFKDGWWSEPNNFGPDINTTYDEFRPAVEFFPDSNNDLMIFSSNRPEGKGGYDLYLVGIDKMIQ